MAMWIQKIEVTDLAGIASASIDLGPGLNILHGPNEIGKSNIVNAVRASLLLPAGSVAAESLLDWNTDATPKVSLTFEQEPQRIWRVRKSYGSGRDAWSYLEFSRDGHDFTQDKRGREVDGALQEILRWGVETPGGRGRRRRGLPESFITTVLIADQSDVVAILEKSLSDDDDESGRQRLTEALQAMAEDPLFKRIMSSAQEKVDEAFTGTGRHRSGRGSPWVRVRDELQAAQRRESELRSQLEESEGTRQRVDELHQELLTAQAQEDECKQELGVAVRDIERKRDREAAIDALTDAEKEVARIESAMGECETNAAAVETARTEFTEAMEERAESEGELSQLKSSVEEERMRVSEIESDEAEQKRRIREQDAQNSLLRLDAEHQECEKARLQAERVKELAETAAVLREEIESEEKISEEAKKLIEQTQGVLDADKKELQELDLQLRFCRWSVSAKRVGSLRGQFEESADSHKRADEFLAKAERNRDQADAVSTPDEDDVAKLRNIEADLRVAQERLAVGLLVSMTPEKDLQVSIEIDGESADHRIVASDTTEFEAARELRVDIPGFGELRVMGGNKALDREVQEAEDRWEKAWEPIIVSTGCRTIPDLEMLLQRCREQLSEAQAFEQEAAMLQVKAGSVDDLERQVTLAEEEEARAKDDLAVGIEESIIDGRGHLTADEYVDSLRENPPDIRNVEEAIETVESKVSEQELLCHKLDSGMSGKRARLEAQREELNEREKELDREKGKLSGEWQTILRSSTEDLERIQRDRIKIDDDLKAINKEAATDVEEARSSLAAAEEEMTKAEKALSEANEEIDRCRSERARLEGELTIQRKAVETEDHEGAKSLTDECAGRLDSLPEPENEEVDDALRVKMEETAARASRKTQELENELQRVEGALEQIGGSYIEEQVNQSQEAIEAVRQQELDLELEFGAWQLLRETLAEAEQQDSVHLGNALVEPVSARMSTLTGGRYGDIAIGPQMDATGIHLAGSERQFDSLSVGTQEQVALMLRLSIAEALGTFLILDDQATQSDPQRMEWIRDVLERAAEEIQVVVMTCHQEDYVGEGLPVDSHVVDLADCVERTP